MRGIVVKELRQTPIEEAPTEVVERKGLGHPDYMCDAMMESVSVALSKYYIQKFGSVMHYNVDKALLAAGSAKQRFGGGRIISPMLLVIGDRATFEVDGEIVPVKEITIKACKDWLKKNIRFVDPERHVRYQVELKSGSPSLVDIFKRKNKVLGANDTSAAVGYAPFSKTEQLVLDIERFLNSRQFKKRFPETGEDIKVMATRKNHEVLLTVATSFVDKYVESEKDYFRKKNEILEQLKAFVAKNTDLKINLTLNTLDQPGRGISGCYLTVTGTSAEDGDSGEVGRGNRVNGIIPLNRPVSNEAVAGKNPVSHVGKIYNILSHHMANKIYKEVPDIKEVYVWLVSQIGQPIDQPSVATAELIMEKGKLSSVKRAVEEVMESELAGIGDFTVKLAQGNV